MAKVVIKSGSDEIICNIGTNERILYGGLRCGVPLPYECATGSCGTCKAVVKQGDVHDCWVEAPGKTNLEPGSGDILMCQTLPASDLLIELDNHKNGGAELFRAPEVYSGVIRSTSEIARDTMLVEVHTDRACTFDAGQFMVLKAAGISGYRAYSMVNFQKETDRLSFIIKRKEGGKLSTWLFGADVIGEKVELFGALGRATFRPHEDMNLLCIAGGSGLAGIASILDRVKQIGYYKTHSIYVFFGVRRKCDAFLLRELSELAAMGAPRVHVVVCFSEEAGSLQTMSAEYPYLQFRVGFVGDVVAESNAEIYDEALAYLAGPPGAVEASLRTIISLGHMSPSRIRFDKFS